MPQKELAIRAKNSEMENATETKNKVNVVTLCKSIIKDLTSSNDWKRQLSSCPMVNFDSFFNQNCSN